MSKKVIDVSSYQGKPDWKKVKAAGVDGAILKIIRKDLTPDTSFEYNWSSCKSVGMPIVGVYNYSYAITVSKAEKDAKKVVAILNGRKAKVWLDVEDKSQKILGRTLIDIIVTYKKVIEAAGLEFGVYTGVSFYNNYIKPYGSVDCDWWIARYPSSSAKTLANSPSLSYQPKIGKNLEGWQWTSKAQIPGINGNVDLNEWYGDIETQDKPVSNPYPVPTRLLKLKTIRMKGNDVKWVQYHLIRLGFLPTGEDDGIFGPKTDKAVRAAQKKYGIKVDGIVGADTRGVLKRN